MSSKNLLLKALDMNIGFIGAGNLAAHMAKGFIKSGAVRASQITASSPETKKETVKELKEMGVKFSPDNKVTIKNSEVIMLAVKPKLIPYVLEEVASNITSDQLVFSFAAGVTIASIEKKLPSNMKVMRGMTNTCLAVKEAATVYAAGTNVTDEDTARMEDLFRRVGLVEEVEEAHVNAVTGLGGSGPAYAYEAIEALADGSVKMGLPRGLAMRLGAQTLIGAGRMLLETKKHPGELKDAICSPEGATIYALHLLERGGFRSLLMDAVEASCIRTKDLEAVGDEAYTDNEEIKKRIREGLHLRDLIDNNYGNK
ncbi:pyrroline-5-carboxylate reductase 1, mitochondrial-like [Styela clava]